VPCLPMVHAIVQRHAGAIVVDNLSSIGENVTRYLPTDLGSELDAWKSEPDATAAAAASNTRGGRHILFPDDDPSPLFLAERQLEPRG